MTSETENKKILLVDDDPELRGSLARFFEGQGFVCKLASGAAEARRHLSRESFDALVVDWMMPGEDGPSLIRSLRAGGEMAPIVMLSAKGDEHDRILGIENGADDYCQKPFSARELLARLRAIWRRGTAPPSKGESGVVLALGPWEIDCQTREIRRAGRPDERLSESEFTLLKIFAKNPGIVLSRDRLMSLCGGGDRDAFDRSIDVRVARARKIIEDDPSKPALIQTARGAGYAYIPPKKDPQP